MLRLARIARIALLPSIALAQTRDHHLMPARIIAPVVVPAALSQAEVRQFNIAALVLAHAKDVGLDEAQRRQLASIAAVAQREIDSLYAQMTPTRGTPVTRQHALDALAALEVETETVSGLTAGVLRDSQYPAAAALCDARYADLAAILDRAGF